MSLDEPGSDGRVMGANMDPGTAITFSIDHADTSVRVVCSENGSGIDIWTVVERIAAGLVGVGFGPDQVLTAMETIRESDWAERFGLPSNADDRRSHTTERDDNPHESDGTVPEACDYCGDVWPCAASGQR